MPGRGPQTFKKRQKEQQRKERQQEKMEKRLRRKELGSSGLAEPESENPLLEALALDEESVAPAPEAKIPATSEANRS